MAQLNFDETVARALEAVYATRDILRRRRLVRDALGAMPSERVLDVGCGPGFYAAELLEQVGPGGSVVGVDESEAMRPSLQAARAQSRLHAGGVAGLARSRL